MITCMLFSLYGRVGVLCGSLVAQDISAALLVTSLCDVATLQVQLASEGLGGTFLSQTQMTYLLQSVCTRQGVAENDPCDPEDMERSWELRPTTTEPTVAQTFLVKPTVAQIMQI